MKIILILEYVIYLVSLCDARLEQPFLSQHALIWRYIGALLLIQVVIGCIFRFKPDGRRILVPYITKYMAFILIWMIQVFFDSGTDTDEFVVLLGFIVTIFLFGLQAARYRAVEELLTIGFIVPNVMLILNNIANEINVFELLGQVNIASFFSSVYSQRVRFNLGIPNPNTLGNLVTCLLCISLPLLAVQKMHKGGVQRILSILLIGLDAFDFITLVDCGTRTGMACFLICAFLFVFLISTQRQNNNSGATRVIRVMSLVFIIVIAGLFIFDRFISAYIGGRHQSFELLGILKGFQYISGVGVFSPGQASSLYGSHLDNYYIYLLITTGIVGLILYLLFFIRLFKDIRKYGDNAITYGVICCFVADMLYGFGETSILYPMFPSAAIFMVLFIGYSIVGVEKEVDFS